MKAARVKFNDFHVAYRVKSSFLARSGGIISEQIGKTGEDRISNIFSRPFPPLTSLETGCYSTCSYPIKMSKRKFFFLTLSIFAHSQGISPFQEKWARAECTNERTSLQHNEKLSIFYFLYQEMTQN